MTAGPNIPALWEAYRANRDSVEAMERLVEAWMPLAQRVMERFAIRLPVHVQRDDLFQAAALGLCQAIESFDPEKSGNAFEPFAIHRIRGSMLDELRRNDRLTRHARLQLRRLETTAECWMQKHGRPPTETELASAAKMTVEVLTELLGRSQPWLSLDQTQVVGTDGSITRLRDVLRDDSASAPDEQAVHRDLLASFRACFRLLETREQKILYLYYFEELRLSEIAELFSLTEARISQIQSMAILKLRAMLQSREQ